MKLSTTPALTCTVIEPTGAKYQDQYVFHEGWALMKKDFQNGRPIPSPGENGFGGIPRALFSHETVIFMGLRLGAAEVVWHRWVAREKEHPFEDEDTASTAFAHFIADQVIEFPMHHTRATKAEWAESYSKCQIRLIGEAMNAVETSISKWNDADEKKWNGVYPDKSQLRVYAMKAMMMKRFQCLLDFRKRTRQHEAWRIQKNREEQAAQQQVAQQQVVQEQFAQQQFAQQQAAQQQFAQQQFAQQQFAQQQVAQQQAAQHQVAQDQVGQDQVADAAAAFGFMNLRFS